MGKKAKISLRRGEEGRSASIGRSHLLGEMLGSERRVRSLNLMVQSLAYVDVAISLTDLEQNRFLYVNPAWVRLYGYASRKVMGKAVAPLLNMSDISGRKLFTIRNQTQNGGWEGYLLNCNSKGDVFMVKLRTSCLVDLDGKMLAMLGVATPVDNEICNSKGAYSRTGKGQRKSKKSLSLKELGQLTPRELEVFTLFGQGRNTRQIAEKLLISGYTVQTHRNHLKKKLGATTTAELNFLSYQWVNDGDKGLH